MENSNEYLDAQEHNHEIVKNEQIDGDDDELIYEDVEYLEEEENILPMESNESLSVLSLDHEAVGVAPLQGKITLANLHEALSLQDKFPLNQIEALAMQPGHIKSPSNQKRTSRSKKSSPNTVKRSSSRIAKQILKQDSNSTIYPTAKGSTKQIGKKIASSPQATNRKRKNSRSRSRTVSSTAKKSKSRSLSRKASSSAKKASSTVKKARSSSQRPRQMKK